METKNQSFFSLSANNATGLPYRTLEVNSRPPTLDLYHYPLRLDNQCFFHPTQGLRYHVRPVNINISQQHSVITRNRKLTTLTHTSTELKYEVTVKFIELKPHPFPI